MTALAKRCGSVGVVLVLLLIMIFKIERGSVCTCLCVCVLFYVTFNSPYVLSRRWLVVALDAIVLGVYVLPTLMHRATDTRHDKPTQSQRNTGPISPGCILLMLSVYRGNNQ